MEAVEEEVVLVREAGPGLEGVDEGAGHDRPAVQHRVVRLVWGGHRHCHTFNKQCRYQILFLSRQISLKFFPLGSYPTKKDCDIFRETYFLITYVLVHELVSEVLEAHGVCEGLAAGLQGEGLVHLAQGEPLSIHRADGDRPQLVAVLIQA